MKALLSLSFLFLGWTTSAGASEIQPDRNVAEYNLGTAALGLKGFDPVSYFAEGGNQPLQGSPELSASHDGVQYFFATEENRELFVANPLKYEPTYGGWCAWAMANGSRVDIDPTIYTINGNRLHFFIAQRAKRNFDRNIPHYEKLADDTWFQFSGEGPRF
ncbi:MAG: hypothetical protein H6624_08085 [Bdellovibrionaceae bacterium]|nr:hypothetical protein [Bdellovibrionales bacterium]MCB9084291.1 hypothetical protein [Pseudobdellovibrionaceae bacterium]